jgi:uncharacterized protein YifN (PemK superfamily)
LTFHPKPGKVLICDFNTGFKAPEMIKKRPVVVVSPRPRRKKQLCIVVPLSTTRPDPKEDFHHRLSSESLPGRLAESETWAKCDMLATVCLERLDRVKIGKSSEGKRLFVSHMLTRADFSAIQKGILAALGLKRLTTFL